MTGTRTRQPQLAPSAGRDAGGAGPGSGTSFADDYPAGPCVSVAVPRRAYVSWVLHGGGELVEVYIGGERTGGVYLTLQRRSLPGLIAGLRAVQGTIPDRHGPAGAKTGGTDARRSARRVRPYVPGHEQGDQR